MKKIIYVSAVAAGFLSATPAFAEPVQVKPIVEARLRYEDDKQDGIADTANAVTMRVRAGAQAKAGHFLLLAEGEGTLGLSNGYNDGLNGKTNFPIVADPQNIELNRLLVQYSGLPKTVVTVGRQRIALDDQRFVGNAGWRQNEQTFDAARIEWSGIKNVKADITYANAVRTIWGVNGFGFRQPAIDGNNVFVNLSYKNKVWGLTGFAYLVDQDEAAVQNFRESSQSYGVRGTAAIPLNTVAKLNLAASYANQRDYHRNPNNYAANYYAGEAALDAKGFKLTSGFEVLGADNGAAFTSFQTPLASLHKFNGFADKFLTTPPNGLRDYYLGASYSFPHVTALSGLNLATSWHSFSSDRLGQKYGTEWDMVGGFKLNKQLNLIGKYASYNSKGGGKFAGDADTKKLWVELDYAF